MGVSPSHLCSDRMYVCGDYKLIVHGGPRGENHITERRRDYRPLNTEDYTFRPPPRPHHMQMNAWIKKRKKDRKRKGEEAPFVTYSEGRKHKFCG